MSELTLLDRGVIRNKSLTSTRAGSIKYIDISEPRDEILKITRVK